MNDKWFFIGSFVGILAGIAIGKFMFSNDSKLPTKNKWSCQEKIEQLQLENKMLKHEVTILFEQNLRKDSIE